MADTKKQYRIVYAEMMAMRHHEAQAYWQRSSFMVAMLGVVLAMIGAALNLQPCEGRWWAVLGLALFGCAISVIWAVWQYLGHRWLGWWNAQIAYAESMAFDDVAIWQQTVGKWEPGENAEKASMVPRNRRDKNETITPPYGVAKWMRRLTYLVTAMFALIAFMMILTLIGAGAFYSCGA